MNQPTAWRFALFICALWISAIALSADKAQLDQLIAARDPDINAIKAQGQAALPLLADLYRQSSDKLKRAKIAWVFYQLGWKSEEAKQAMMSDVHTDDATLRLQVQWALGRVSSDDHIVALLLETMRDDDNVLFREKAACALASDQIHLTAMQRYKLLEGLVLALDDPKIDVRRNAVKALEIQTGQTKSYNADAPVTERHARVKAWNTWLNEYRAQL